MTVITFRRTIESSLFCDLYQESGDLFHRLFADEFIYTVVVVASGTDVGTGKTHERKSCSVRSSADGFSERFYSDFLHCVRASVDDVIEASHNRGIEMPKKDAEEFIAFYFVDLKGLINGEPIRNWRNLLKSWDNNKLVETDSILGADYAGYEEFKKLPPYLQNQIVNEQTKFGGRKVTRATVKAIEQYRSSVLEQNREAV